MYHSSRRFNWVVDSKLPQNFCVLCVKRSVTIEESNQESMGRGELASVKVNLNEQLCCAGVGAVFLPSILVVRSIEVK